MADLMEISTGADILGRVFVSPAPKLQDCPDLSWYLLGNCQREQVGHMVGGHLSGKFLSKKSGHALWNEINRLSKTCPSGWRDRMQSFQSRCTLQVNMCIDCLPNLGQQKMYISWDKWGIIYIRIYKENEQCTQVAFQTATNPNRLTEAQYGTGLINCYSFTSKRLPYWTMTSTIPQQE